MQELDMFIPFAKAGQDGTLNIVRTAFVDVANLSLKNFHVHMSKVSIVRASSRENLSSGFATR